MRYDQNVAFWVAFLNELPRLLAEYGDAAQARWIAADHHNWGMRTHPVLLVNCSSSGCGITVSLPAEISGNPFHLARRLGFVRRAERTFSLL
jgi:hypothetical protein